MRTRIAFLWAFTAWPLSAGAEDMTTLAGQTYTNIVVERYDQRGLFIRHDGGNAKVGYKEISPELRGYYRKMARDPMSASNPLGEKEEPAGTNDLATLSGPIYRNVVVKRVEEYAVQIVHDGGSAKVYFSEIPKSEREKYRTAAAVPDAPPGTNDLVATDGQIFRNVEILRTEPDGLTFHHDGGVTKLRFPALPEELREKHGYDPAAARKYQRAVADEKERAQEKAAAREAQKKSKAPAPETPIILSEVQTDQLKDGQYRIRFTVRNPTGRAQSIRAIPYDHKQAAIIGGKKFDIPPDSGGEKLEIVVSIIQPKRLTIYCGDYQTNRTLRW